MLFRSPFRSMQDQWSSLLHWIGTALHERGGTCSMPASSTGPLKCFCEKKVPCNENQCNVLFVDFTTSQFVGRSNAGFTCLPNLSTASFGGPPPHARGSRQLVGLWRCGRGRADGRQCPKLKGAQGSDAHGKRLNGGSCSSIKDFVVLWHGLVLLAVRRRLGCLKRLTF